MRAIQRGLGSAEEWNLDKTESRHTRVSPRWRGRHFSMPTGLEVPYHVSPPLCVPDGVAHDLLATGALSERYTSALNLWTCWLCGDYGSSPQGGSE